MRDPNSRIDKPKGVTQILDEQIDTAVHEYQRSNIRLSISAFSAGLEVGFSVFLMGILYTLFHGNTDPSTLHIMLSFAYPIGFIFVIIGRSELFTEHTTLAILPVLNGVISVKSLVQLWLLILAGNLAGGYLFSIIVVNIAPAMDIISLEAFSSLAHKMLDYSPWTILGSAVIAGWLMGLLSWLVASSQESISRIFVIILVTATIGMGGLHHSIVGSIEVFSGMLVDLSISISDYLIFQGISVLGNAIGGVVFVAVIKFGQGRKDA